MATILVADDEPSIVELLVEVIEEAGHSAIPATNGRQAWAIAQQQHPDIVITDIMMPEMSGYDLLLALRSDPVFVDTPVILISASHRSGYFTLDPTVTFVPKPLDLALIERMLP